MTEVTIAGMTYVVVAERDLSYVAKGRVELTIRKRLGKRLHYVVRYETGEYSSIVAAA